MSSEEKKDDVQFKEVKSVELSVGTKLVVSEMIGLSRAKERWFYVNTQTLNYKANKWFRSKGFSVPKSKLDNVIKALIEVNQV